MNKLTEAKCYADIESYIKGKGWDSKTIASKIVWYGKSCGKYGTALVVSPKETHLCVYNWLLDYRENHHSIVGFEYKYEAIKMLQDGATVQEVYSYFFHKENYVSKVTLYKYYNSYVRFV